VANLITDLVDPAELTEYVRAYNDETLRARFVLEQILPNREIADVEFRVRSGGLTDVDVAEYRAWDTQPPMTGRPGIARKRGEIPPVSRQIPLLEEESLRLRAMQTGTDNPIIDAIFDDVERMVRAVQGRIELARGDVLTDGIVTINENGVNVAVDFGVPAGHKPTRATTLAWTVANAATAFPIKDLLEWLELYKTDTGVLPRGILMSRALFPALAVNAEVRAYAQAGAATGPARVNLATIGQIFSEFGIPPLLGLGADLTGDPFYDVNVRVNGVVTPVLPEGRVVFVPPADEPVGNTFYGITAEAVRLIERNLIVAQDAPGVVAVNLQNDNPVQTFTLATAVALPAIVNPELIFTADVTA
jgi:hypothetical protein